MTTSDTPAILSLQQPRTLVFGPGCLTRCADDFVTGEFKRVFVVASPSAARIGKPLMAALQSTGHVVTVWANIRHEPTVDDFRAALAAARDARAEAVIGLGGGSPMDVAKLVAALLGSSQDVTDAWGIGKLRQPRQTHLVCLPTTAGTGSEVSPNAVLLDDAAKLKKAVIGPQLVPDAAYVDPMLTLTVPPDITAATGMDALTHCIEAYANKFAHPLVDPIALEGVRLIAANLATAVENGNDVAARTAVAQGSLFGGMCLGPVNTAAVHALSYPLGSEFKIAHGVSNAVLLPHVLDFNLSAAPQRYAAIALAMGASRGRDDLDTAYAGLQIIRELSRRIGIPNHMKKLKVPADAIEHMATAAMNVQRLLVRNVREVTRADAIEIYRRAF
jgi:alcohol dehydrogenase class IV